MAKVKICKHCSRIDIDKVQKCAEKYNCKLKVGCFGHCRKKDPKLIDKAYGLLGKKLKICSNEKDFLDVMKKYMKKESKK